MRAGYSTTGLESVVCDAGSVTTRAGFGGEDAPRVACPSAVGFFAGDDGTERSVVEMDALGWAQPSLLVRALHSARHDELDALNLRLVQHCFDRLGADPAEHALLVTEPPGASAAARRRLVTQLFETLGVPALCVCKTVELVAIASGRTTALVLDIGGTSTAAAVIEGCMSPHAQQSKVGSLTVVSDFFRNQLQGMGHGLEPACVALKRRNPRGGASSPAISRAPPPTAAGGGGGGGEAGACSESLVKFRCPPSPPSPPLPLPLARRGRRFPRPSAVE